MAGRFESAAETTAAPVPLCRRPYGRDEAAVRPGSCSTAALVELQGLEAVKAWKGEICQNNECNGAPFNVPRFVIDYVPISARQTCTLDWFYNEISILVCTLPRHILPLRSSAATLHDDPISFPPSHGAVRVCFLGRPSRAPLPPDAFKSQWSESPARQPRVT